MTGVLNKRGVWTQKRLQEMPWEDWTRAAPRQEPPEASGRDTRRDRPSPPLQRGRPCPHRHPGLRPPGCERMKPPSLWYFVTAALGSKYNQEL